MRLAIEIRPRSGSGRFGGGWQWKLGWQSTDLTRRRGYVILSLVVLTVSFEWGMRT